MKKIIIVLIACVFASTSVQGEEKGKAAKLKPAKSTTGAVKPAPKATKLAPKPTVKAGVKARAKQQEKAIKPAETIKPVESAKPVDVAPEATHFLPEAKPVEFAKLAKQVKADSAKPAEKQKSAVEIGIFPGGSVLTSSSPIEIGVETKPGMGFRFVGPLWEDFSYTLGVAQRSYGLSMDEVYLGDVRSLTASSTLRFNHSVWRLRPYAGWGIHYTELSQALLADGSLKTRAASGFGPVAEWGVKILIGKEFYIDVNSSQYFWTARGVRFESNVGNALISEIDILNPHWTGFSIGKTF